MSTYFFLILWSLVGLSYFSCSITKLAANSNDSTSLCILVSCPIVGWIHLQSYKFLSPWNLVQRRIIIAFHRSYGHFVVTVLVYSCPQKQHFTSCSCTQQYGSYIPRTLHINPVITPPFKPNPLFVPDSRLFSMLLYNALIQLVRPYVHHSSDSVV